MSDNPFAAALAGGEQDGTELEARAPESEGEKPQLTIDFEAALEAAPDDVDAVAPLEDEDAEALQGAEQIEKDGKKREVVSKETFLRRIRTLTAKKKGAEAERDSAKAEAVAVKAQLEQIKATFGKKKPEQWQWDSDFLDAFEAVAGADPEVKSVAARIMDAMKTKQKGGKPTMTQPTETEKPAAAEPSKEQSELLIVTERVVNRDAKRVFTETLQAAGVDEKFAKAITNAGMKELSVAQRAELDGDKVVAYVKKYLKANELTSKDILKSAAPAEGDADKKAKPATSGGQSRPAPAVKDAKPASEAGPKYKSAEEFISARKNKLAGLARELGLS